MKVEVTVLVSPSLILIVLNMVDMDVNQHNRVPGETKRREVELDPEVSPEELNNEQGGGAGLRKLDFFRFGLFLNSSAADIVLMTLPSTAVETATAQCTSRCAAMARGHRLNLTLPLFWRRSTVSPVFFGRYPRSSLHSFVPFPPCHRP